MNNEQRKMAEDGIFNLLLAVGVDPTADAVKDTPARVVRAYQEMTAGYAEDPAFVLATEFAERDPGMVLLVDIPFVSLCEHHLLPFTGVAHVGYLAGGPRVVGLSKLARLVDIYARRLQLQERLTREVVDALATYLEPAGAGCIIEGQHSCMSCRGIRKSGSSMVTSSLCGVFKDDPKVKDEFFELVKLSKSRR